MNLSPVRFFIIILKVKDDKYYKTNLFRLLNVASIKDILAVIRRNPKGVILTICVKYVIISLAKPDNQVAATGFMRHPGREMRG